VTPATSLHWAVARAKSLRWAAVRAKFVRPAAMPVHPAVGWPAGRRLAERRLAERRLAGRRLAGRPSRVVRFGGSAGSGRPESVAAQWVAE
jgi:hypothetical protein